MTVSIRRHCVYFKLRLDGLEYFILFTGGNLVFVMLVGDEYVKRFMHMVEVEI